MGATAAFTELHATPSRTGWRERRELFPEGVASGDPDSNSVLLWTRCPRASNLTVEDAEDQPFRHVAASGTARVYADSDWTCRVLVGGLKSARVYWYRFTDGEGNGSRVGRTITAPGENDPRLVSFAFVSCQNANQGAQNAYRRMIFEDERASEADRLGFVLHLGDFIYEIVWYPEDRPQGMYDRRVRDLVRYPSGEKIRDFHIPTTLDDYRAVYRAYLHDPDLQDARARWPFVNMWDNHEFSWLGWQSLQKFQGQTRPAQTRKVAANQAFFEFQPARMARPNGNSLERFDGPSVQDAPVAKFDDHGLGQEANNLAAIREPQGYRAMRWGRNVELVVTDQQKLPLGRADRHGGGRTRSPAMTFLRCCRRRRWRFWMRRAPITTETRQPRFVPSMAKSTSPTSAGSGLYKTVLRRIQKAWFLERLKASNATWKIWGNTTATLDMRADPQNLPPPGSGSAGHGPGTLDSVSRTGARRTWSGRRFTTLSSSTGSRDSPPSQAIGTVSGRAWRLNRFLLNPSLRWVWHL